MKFRGQVTWSGGAFPSEFSFQGTDASLGLSCPSLLIDYEREACFHLLMDLVSFGGNESVVENREENSR